MERKVWYTLGMELCMKEYAGKKICVALSGGADSVCLLHLFYTHAEEYGASLSAIHVEHGIRGEESLRDMEFCKALCKEWEIPLKIVRVNVPAMIEENGGGNIECVAWLARLNAFRALIDSHEADLVATAHHRNDVVETVLFRLARGTSPAGMKAIRNFPFLIRPLLNVSRDEILQYVHENSLHYVEDSTNADEHYTRNYIRHTVLPAFEKIHKGAAEHLARFAAQCAQDDEYLTSLAKKEIECVGAHGDMLVPVDLPEPLFMRACFLCMGAEADYTSANLAEISKLKTLQTGKKVRLAGGKTAAREYGNIVFYYEMAEPIEERPFEEDFLVLAPHPGLRADLDAFPAGCVVRSRREGDFIVPYGGQKKSLKKFLTDRKISARLGRRLTLVAHGEEILVIKGVEISDKVKITQKTKRIGYFG